MIIILGFATLYCKDKENRPVVFIMGKLYRRTDLDNLLNQYMVYQFEKADRNTTDQGWAVVMDASSLNVLRMDRSFFHFFVEVLNSYYPLAIKYVLVVNMPQTMNWLSKIMIKGMEVETRSMIKFVKEKKLRDYISVKDIPKHLGGKHNLEADKEKLGELYKPLDQFDNFNYTYKQIENFRYKYKNELAAVDLPKPKSRLNIFG